MDKAQQLQNDDFEYPIISPQNFVKDDYIRLWEYFENRADMLKGRLWTIGTWLLGFNSALLGFIFGTQLIVFDEGGFTIPNPSVVLILALAGCVLCLYASILINDYGKHIQRNWDRAKFLAKKLPLVTEALKGKSSVEDKQEDGLVGNTSTEDESITALPAIAKNLIGFSLIYFVAFLTIAAFVLLC